MPDAPDAPALAISADLRFRQAVGQIEEPAQRRALSDRGSDRHDALVDLAVRTVDRHEGSLREDAATDREAAAVDVDGDRLAADDAGLVECARDDRRMAERPTSRRHDAVRRKHAADILRAGDGAEQDDVLAALGAFHRRVGIENDRARRLAGRRAEALRQQRRRRQPLRVEARLEELEDLFVGCSLHGFLRLDHPLVHEVGGDADGGGGRSFRRTDLQHVERAGFHRELDVDRVAVDPLQRVAVPAQRVRDLRGHRRIGELDRRMGARDQILPLVPDEILAVERPGAVVRVAREGDAGAGVLVRIAEDHRLDGDRGAEVVGDPVVLPVGLRARTVPGAKDGRDGFDQVVVRIGGDLRALSAQVVEDRGFERCETRLRRVAAGPVDVIANRRGQIVGVEVEHGFGVHPPEAGPAVEDEGDLAGLPGERQRRGRGEPEIEDRVHHAGHADGGARAHRDHQRVGVGREAPAGLSFDARQASPDLGLHLRRDAPALRLEGVEGVGADHDRRWDRDARPDHAGEPRRLAAIGDDVVGIDLLDLPHEAAADAQLVHPFPTVRRCRAVAREPTGYPRGTRTRCCGWNRPSGCRRSPCYPGQSWRSSHRSGAHTPHSAGCRR